MTEDFNFKLGIGKTCFIISPIGDKFGAVGTPERSRYEESLAMWDEVLEPACAVFGIAPVRADKISETGEIPDQIFTYLRDADIVIADLSHANPNVMYELGLRHSAPGKITIQIGEHGFLPFDVTSIRTIQFRRNEAGRIAARSDLVGALRVALNGGGTPLRATQVFTVGAALSAAELSSDVKKSAVSDESLAEDDGPGIAELLAEGEEGLSHTADVLTDSSSEIIKVNGLFAASTEKLNAAAQQPGKTFSTKLLLIRQLASDLSAPVESLQSLSDDFFADVERVDAMMRYIFDRVESDEEDPAQLGGFFDSAIGLIEAATEASVGIVNFRDSALTLRKMSKSLAPASRTLVMASNRYLEGIALMESWRGPLEANRASS